jgi:hypothetical protein
MTVLQVSAARAQNKVGVILEDGDASKVRQKEKSN